MNPNQRNPGQKPLTATQLALQMRARRTKRMMMYNLGLLGLLVVLASGYFGYVFLHRGAKVPDVGTADSQTDSGNPSAVSVDNPPPSKPSEPVKYVSKKYIFICDTTAGLQPRMGHFLPDMLSAFSKLHQMDVIVLGNDGSFTSVTHGLVPITPASRSAATDAVSHAPAATASSFWSALKAAAAENPDAIYLMTTADQIKQFGPDPLARVQRAGTIPSLNCVIFTTPGDSPADVAAFKALVKGMHGDVVSRSDL